MTEELDHVPCGRIDDHLPHPWTCRAGVHQGTPPNSRPMRVKRYYCKGTLVHEGGHRGFSVRVAVNPPWRPLWPTSPGDLPDLFNYESVEPE